MPLITGRPNIIVIMTDDQDTGSVRMMPTVMEQLVARGTWFRNFFITTPLCCPARSSILTGEYAHNHGVMTNFPDSGGYDKFIAGGNEAKTIAVALQSAGYNTGLIGKYLNHFPGPYPDSYIPPGWSDFQVSLYWNNYYQYWFSENGKKVRYWGQPADYQTYVIRREAVAFIDSAVVKGRPFFLMVTPYAPHQPAIPAPMHASLFPGVLAPRTASFNEADVRDKDSYVRVTPRLTQVQIDSIDAEYRRRLQTLQGVDEMVAQIMERLSRYSLTGRTYVLFMSDNGYHMGEHRMIAGKNTPYEEDLRVPLIVRGPGVPQNLRYGMLTLNIDLAPTIAELAGVTMPGVPDGRSLVPFLRGTPPVNWRTGFLAEAQGWSALRTKTFAYLEWESGARELYYMPTDPLQLDNIYYAASKTRLAELSEELAQLRTCAGIACALIEDKADTATFTPTLTLAPKAVSEQTVFPDSTLPQLLRVIVTDQNGTPVPGVPLVWRTNSGHADSTYTSTNAKGVSTNWWTVGHLVGRYRMRVSGPGLVPIDFTAVVKRTLP